MEKLSYQIKVIVFVSIFMLGMGVAVATPDVGVVKDLGGTGIVVVPGKVPGKVETQKVIEGKDSDKKAIEPKNASEALSTGKVAIDQVKSKQYWDFSFSVVLLLMFVWKFVITKWNMKDKIGKRWSYIVLAVLSFAAFFLSKFVGNVSWETALSILTSSASMGFLVDFIKRGVLGVEVTTKINSVKEKLR